MYKMLEKKMIRKLLCWMFGHKSDILKATLSDAANVFKTGSWTAKELGDYVREQCSFHYNKSLTGKLWCYRCRRWV